MIRSKSYKKIFKVAIVVLVLINVYKFLIPSSFNSFLIKDGTYKESVEKDIITNDSISSQIVDDAGKIDWHDYKFIQAEELRVGPGEKGVPFELTDPSEIEMNKIGLHEEGIGTIASEKISLNRSLPDRRLPACKSKKYLKDLPKTSVIITFHNEHWTLLLRCLHSVFNRSPPELLHEIILVNDKSSESASLELVKSYIATHFDGKVKIFENSERSGLIVSRVKGAKKATGEVILFLDSHMEVNTNWLPPLLEPIRMNSKVATVPIVGGIDAKTFYPITYFAGSRGGFDWTMRFQWFPLRAQDKVQLHEPHEYMAMPGGAYAISREFFFHLGAYDEGMQVWNGENFEITFKIWLCGGRLLEIPCSHIFHMSKLRRKYHEIGLKINGSYVDYSARNLKRMAEVWMDEYKEKLYKIQPKRFSIDAGDLTKQFELKKRLNCKPFKYYIEEIAPEIAIRYEDDKGCFASGAIISDAHPELCFTYKNDLKQTLTLEKCSENKTNPQKLQTFTLTWNRCIQIQWPGWYCVDANRMNIEECYFGFGNQFWKYEILSHQIFSPYQRACMTTNTTSLEITKAPCNVSDINQKFSWGYLNKTACANWENFGVELP